MELAERRQLLDEAIIECEKLKNFVYDIVIGKNENTVSIKLGFPLNCFYHLLGLHYLKDVNELRKSASDKKIDNKTHVERQYDNLVKNNNGLRDKVVNSEYFEDIASRLYAINDLIYVLDSNAETYFSKCNYYSCFKDIEYDYVFHATYNSLYLDFYFLINAFPCSKLVSTFSDLKPTSIHARRPFTLLSKTKTDIKTGLITRLK